MIFMERREKLLIIGFSTILILLLEDQIPLLAFFCFFSEQALDTLEILHDRLVLII